MLHTPLSIAWQVQRISHSVLLDFTAVSLNFTQIYFIMVEIVSLGCNGKEIFRFMIMWYHFELF